MRKTCVLLLSLVAVGCGPSGGAGGTTGGTTGGADGGGGDDMAMVIATGDMAAGKPDLAKPPISRCGVPGDPGNSIGVGQYCKINDDCTGTAGTCSTLGNILNTDPTDNTYFCTILGCACDGGVQPDGGTGGCGDHAYCDCSDPRGHACAPEHCNSYLPDGGK